VAVILPEALPRARIGALDENSTIALSLILTEDGIEHADEEPFVCQASVIWAAATEDGRSMLGLRFISRAHRTSTAQALSQALHSAEV